MTQLDEDLEQLVASIDWSPTFSYPFQESDHITLQEAKVLKTLLIRRSDQVSNRDARVMIFVDSKASLGAYGK